MLRGLWGQLQTLCPDYLIRILTGIAIFACG